MAIDIDKIIDDYVSGGSSSGSSPDFFFHVYHNPHYPNHLRVHILTEEGAFAFIGKLGGGNIVQTQSEVVDIITRKSGISEVTIDWGKVKQFAGAKELAEELKDLLTGMVPGQIVRIFP